MSKSLQLFLLLPLAILMAESPHRTLPREYVPPPYASTSNWHETVDIPKFIAKWRKTPPTWMRRGVRKELAPFYEKKITQEALARTFEKVSPADDPSQFSTSRIRIIDNKVYRMGSEGSFDYERFFRTLGRICDYPGVPDMPNIDFLLCQMDAVPLDYFPQNFWITENFEDQAPIMGFARHPDAPYVLLIPDVFMLDQWHKISKEILSQTNSHPWESKQKKAFWRGQLPDFHCALPSVKIVEDYANQPRFIISEFSLAYPHLVDAGFTSPGYASESLWNQISHFTKPDVSFLEHLKYAYLPFLDGTLSSWPELPSKLLSNSVCMKHPGYLQWFYEGLDPYVHYIPFYYRLENLRDQVEWALSHEKECFQIVRHANQFVLDNLMVEDLYFYQLYLFLEYAKCQDFDTREFLKEVEEDPNWERIR